MNELESGATGLDMPESFIVSPNANFIPSNQQDQKVEIDDLGIGYSRS